MGTQLVLLTVDEADLFEDEENEPNPQQNFSTKGSELANKNGRNTPEGELLTKFETEVLDLHHQTLSLWQRPRSVAIWNMLVDFDLTMPVRAELVQSSGPCVGLMQHLKWIDDGLAAGIRFLWNAEKNVLLSPVHDEVTVLEARDFLGHSKEYAVLCDFHSGFGSGLYSIDVDEKQRRVRFLHQSTSETSLEPLGFMEDKDALWQRLEKGIGRTEDMVLASRLLRKVIYLIESGRVVIRDVSSLKDVRLDDLMRTQVPQMAFPIHTDISLGRFTLDEFQRFWLAVFKWSVAASSISFEQTRETGSQPVDCVATQYHERTSFTSMISRIADLDSSTVTACLDTLTLGAGTSKPDIFLQPFICDASSVAWSPHVIQLSSPQRNLLKLMSRVPRYKSISDNAIGERERHIARELGQLLGSRGFQFKVNIELPDALGEIDIMAIRSDCPEQLLLIEVKAVLDVDEINEVDHATKEQLRAQLQLQKAEQILRELSPDQKKSLWRQPPWGQITEIYSIVVTPNSQPSSKYDHSTVPAMTFNTWKSKLRPRDYKSPKRLFRACRDKEWIQFFSGGEHFYIPIQVGDVTYEVPSYGFEESEKEFTEQ